MFNGIWIRQKKKNTVLLQHHIFPPSHPGGFLAFDTHGPRWGWMCHVWTCLIQLLLSRASNRYWSCWMNIPYVQWRIWCEREQPKIPNFVNRCLGYTIFSVALGWTLGRWKINVEGPRDFYSCCIYACMMVHSGNANPLKVSLPQGSSKSMDLMSKFPILCLWDIS